MAKLAILTSGGDSPGMNMAVWAACQKLEATDWQVFGVREGFAGLLRGDLVSLNPIETIRYTRLGGTFLGTSRDPNFAQKIPEALKQIRKQKITHLMVLGGNGSLRGAAAMAKANIKVVGLPATIDNDVAGSDDSIGFDTAANFGLQLLDQFRDTVEALPRLCVLETLGGDTGFLADRVYSVGGADFRLIPERPLSLNKIESLIRSAIAQKGFALVVASEGYPNLESVVLELEKRVGLRLRFARPSHTMRGGRPSAHDRMLARALAEAGIDALARGKSGMVAWRGGKAKLISFDAVPQRKAFRS